MSEKLQLKGGISEPCSNIPLNWRDMRSEFGYKLLYVILLGAVALRNNSQFESTTMWSKQCVTKVN